MKKILIAEDDPGLQDIYKIILEKAGYLVTILSDGADILNNLYQKPDLFLLDKQLTGSNGLDLCRFLKQNRNTKKIPVILISASVGIGELAREAGADDFIEKPFDKNYLLGMIAKYLAAKQNIA